MACRDARSALSFPLLTLSLLVSGLNSLGCFEKPLSPVAPTWDVQLNVPLMNRTYTVNQLVEKDPTLLHSDGSGLLVYSTSQQFSAIAISENLKVNAASEYYQMRVGKFAVKAPAPKVKRISAVELNPAFGDSQGQAVILPSSTFSLTNQTFSTITEIHHAALIDGKAILTFTNRLQIPIDNINATVRSQYGEVLHFTHTATVQPNDSVSAQFSLANLTIGDAWTLNLSGRFPATSNPVTVDPTSPVFVRLEFPTELEASQALAQLPPNTFTTGGSIVVDDSTKVDNADIRAGILTVTLNNSLGVSGQATLVIPELRQSNGGPFTQAIPFSSNQQNVRSDFALNGYTVRPLDKKMTYAITTQTYDSGNNFVAIDSSMGVSGTVTTSVIYFQNFQGTIKPTTVGVNLSKTIDLGEVNRLFSGTAKLSQAKLVLIFTTPARYPIDLNTVLTGRSSATGQMASLSLPANQRRVTSPQTTITLSETNSDLVKFLNSFSGKLPDQFTLLGNAVLNPEYTSGALSASDSLGTALSIDIPLKAAILNGLAQDTTQVNLSSETRKDISHANYGKVQFEIQNGLPAAVQISLSFLDAQRMNLLTLPKASQPPIAVSGATVDGEGRVVVPASSTSFVELVADDVNKIQLLQYAAFAMSIWTSGGGSVPVQFRTTDSVHVRAFSTLNYRVNFK